MQENIGGICIGNYRNDPLDYNLPGCSYILKALSFYKASSLKQYDIIFNKPGVAGANIINASRLSSFKLQVYGSKYYFFYWMDFV